MMRHHGRFYNFLSKVEYQQFKKSTDALHDKPGRSNYAEGVIQHFRDLTQQMRMFQLKKVAHQRQHQW